MKKTFLLSILPSIIFLTGCSINKPYETQKNSSTGKFYNEVIVNNSQQNDLKTLDNKVTDIYSYQNSGENIIMIPGMGLSHYIYTNTPDGRQGWSDLFYNSGYNVSVFNQSENVASSKSGSKWTETRIWKRWGFGNEKGQPYNETRFPTDNIEKFYKSMPYRDGGKGKSGSKNEKEVLKRYLEENGPSYIIFHSAAGRTVFELAKENDNLIKGLIAIEPVGCPTSEKEISNIPILAVYGDYIQSRRQTGRLQSCQKTVDILNERGVNSKLIKLTEKGIEGNTHLMMQDNNNKYIANLIKEWINNR